MAAAAAVSAQALERACFGWQRRCARGAHACLAPVSACLYACTREPLPVHPRLHLVQRLRDSCTGNSWATTRHAAVAHASHVWHAQRRTCFLPRFSRRRVCLAWVSGARSRLWRWPWWSWRSTRPRPCLGSSRRCFGTGWSTSTGPGGIRKSRRCGVCARCRRSPAAGTWGLRRTLPLDHHRPGRRRHTGTLRRWPPLAAQEAHAHGQRQLLCPQSGAKRIPRHTATCMGRHHATQGRGEPAGRHASAFASAACVRAPQRMSTDRRGMRMLCSCHDHNDRQERRCE